MARDDGHDSREGASFQPVAVEEVPPARSACRSTSRRRRRAPCDAGRTSLRDAQDALLKTLWDGAHGFKTRHKYSYSTSRGMRYEV